jgi:hypothetical protein
LPVLGLLGRALDAGLPGFAGRLGDCPEGGGDVGLLDVLGREGGAAGRCAGAAFAALEVLFFSGAPQKGHRSASSSSTD